MSGRLIVFLRHYNDADHILPILYRWTQMTDQPVVVLMHEVVVNYPLIVALAKLPAVTVLVEGKVLDFAIAQTADPNPRQPERAAKLILDDLVAPGSRAVLLFDQRDDGLSKAFCAAARARGLPTVAVPHGEFTQFSLMMTHSVLEVDIRMIRPGRTELFAHFDHVVYSSRSYAQWAQQIDNRKKVILGSARYCRQWLDILPTLPLPQQRGVLPPKTDRRRIALVLRSHHYSINWQEVGHAIHLALQFPDVDLVVKLHPRREYGVDLQLPKTEDCKLRHPTSQVHYVADEIESGALVDWCEVMLSLLSAIGFQAIQARKPLLELAHTFAYESVLTEQLPVTQTKSRDHLVEWYFKLLVDWPRDALGDHFYEPAAWQRFITDEIEAGTAPVLDRYVRYLSDLIAHSSGAVKP